MSHMTEQDRCIIENLLNAGKTPRSIAKELGRSHSTVLRELQKHRKENEADIKRKRNFCIHRRECFRKDLCKIPPQNCPGRCCQCKMVDCQKKCLSYVADSCSKLMASPFVCNGCKELKGCQKKKYFYTSCSAMREYETTLHECRKGIDVSEAEIRQYNELIKQGGFNGQSLHHIMTTYKDVFQKCEKTIYNYFNDKRFSLPRGEMPRMCMRKEKKCAKIRHKIDPQYRIGRTLADYKQWKMKHPELTTVEMDSVIGRVGGKVLLTLQFECGMMLAWLRDTNNSQSVLDYFDRLERKLGLELFRKMFPVLLTDNGSEFSNPSAIETSPITGEPRTKVFYCDPNASWQKGHIENNHTNLRRILLKGYSFDKLTQSDIDLVLSHLNSYFRKAYDNVPAIQQFSSLFGPDVLEFLHLTVIPPEAVILNEKLLRGKLTK